MSYKFKPFPTCPYASIRTEPSLTCSKRSTCFEDQNTLPLDIFFLDTRELPLDIYIYVSLSFLSHHPWKVNFLNPGLAVFCRFHSLEEFDEGKRSCRKRLDGHNRRRRKPQPEPLSRSGSFLSNYQG